MEIEYEKSPGNARNKAIAAGVAILCAVLSIVCASYTGRRPSPVPAEQAATAVSAPEIMPDAAWNEYVRADMPGETLPKREILYIVRIAGDEVRAEKPDNPKNYILLKNIDPRTMRETDRAALMRGIEIYSHEELQYFLEDFGS